MPHKDSPTGQQFHVRYTPRNGDKGPYWTHVFTSRSTAERECAWFHKNGYEDAKVFVRDVPPWRELDTCAKCGEDDPLNRHDGGMHCEAGRDEAEPVSSTV